MREQADEQTIREYAIQAYNDLGNFPEFGEETRIAIIDTAGMLLYDAGYDVDQPTLRRIARGLAG